MRQVLLSIFLSIFVISASANTVDSLLLLLNDESTLDDYGRLYELNMILGNIYTSHDYEDYEKGTAHYTLAYEYAEKLEDYDRIVISLTGVGSTYRRRNLYQEALKNYSLALEYEDLVEDNKSISTIYTYMSAVYQALADYEKAYDNQMKALLIAEASSDSTMLANGLYNIGSIFYYQEQYESALEHYQKAMDICTAKKLEKNIYACVAALGTTYEKLGDNTKSLQYNYHSLKLAEKLNYKSGVAYAKGNIAANYREKGDLKKSEELLIQSIDAKLELGSKWAAIGGKIDLSKVYLQWNKPKKAISVLKRALLMSKEVDSKARKPEIYNLLAEAHDNLKNVDQAYFYTKKYIAVKDSLLNEKTVEEMGKAKRRFEAEIQEQEIAILKTENELLGKNKKIQKLQAYIFAFGLLALVMFLWWYKSKLNYQNRMNQVLEEKNAILNQKSEEIQIKNKQLEHSNEDLAQFAYVASHDLKEPLRMINSYTSLLERRYNDKFDDTGKEFMHYITDACKRMQTLLDDLLDFSRAGSQAAPTEFVSVSNVMVYVEANLRHRLQTLNATLVVKDETLPAVKAHRTQLLQLLQNLVSNGVKFKGERDPKVIVGCVKEKDQYVISVKDNGIGISKENLEKVFEMFRRLHTREEYEGTGIGLATCKRIVTSWGGDIWVESVEGEGSTFSFSVPLSMAQFETAAELESVEV